jgi:hypothetical protein
MAVAKACVAARAEDWPIFPTIPGWELTDSAAQLERFGT